MPAMAATPYKNRRPDVPPGVQVRRYLSLAAAVRTVRDRQLRLTLIDHLRMHHHQPVRG
jgi:hypothetical protein